jgi:hypothetical protein
MRTMIAVLGAAGLLAGCGQAKKSFDEGFDTKFHESFVASCVKSAVGSGAPQEVADKVCKCASDKIKDRFSVGEKMKLKKEQILPLVEECRSANRA